MAELRKSPWPGWVTVQSIGRGSFGAVYEIRRELVDGTVEAAAMKVITIPQNPEDISEMYGEGYDSESITASFRAHLKSIVAEYTLMQKLEGSANVVNCKDICYIQHDDDIGWDIFIRMELLTPLMKALPDSTAEETILKIGQDICNALVLCKKYGIIHRDIKPQNIFVSPNGGYKLGDFGIAKTVEKTMGGTKIGTYKYMAPEVYNNQPYGSGADIYSLGLVLYWLLNEHRMPFMPLPPAKIPAGQDEQARQRRLTGQPLPPPAHGSEALKKIVLKACAYAPEERFGSAEEMRLALQDCLYAPAAPQKPQQEPPAPPDFVAEPTVIDTPIAEPTVIDTPVEFAFETAAHNVIPQPRPEQQPEAKKAPAGNEKKKWKSRKLIWAALGVLLLYCGLLAVWQFTYNAQAAKNRGAQQLMDSGEYSAAAEAFDGLEDYKDSAEKAKEARGLLEQKESQRVLREDPESAKYLGDNNWNYPPVFGSDVTRDEVTAIVFRDTTQNAPETAWDVSQNADRSVLAWTSGSQGHYTLVIAAQGGVIAPENCCLLFAYYPNVTSIQFNDAFDTSKVTNMSSMFSGCKNLSSLNLSGFDTSKVTDMHWMFYNCEKLTSLNLSGFKTSNVTDMHNMFEGCKSMTSLNLSSFDTSNVTNMSSMFSGCKNLSSLNLSNFDTSNVTDMNWMFDGCKSMTSLNLSSFDTSKVTDMSWMFDDCENLTSLDVSSFNTSNVTDMSRMFDDCENLTSLDVSSFDTSKVTDMSGMFSGCDSLTYLNLGWFDTSSVTDYDYFMNYDATYNGRPWLELFE